MVAASYRHRVASFFTVSDSHFGFAGNAPDESPGPGDGFILFPVLGEAALFLMGYALVVAALALPRIKPLLKFCFKNRKPDGGV